ncbi:response regulator [bacterium]|jgi:CheY-like chemotaxis protein|nr:response regulator [bacterium]
MANSKSVPLKPCDDGAILIVEDEKFIRLVIRKSLEPLGLDILEAVDGVQAEKILQTRTDFRVVILDIMMPHQNGIQTLANMRENGNSVPVIMLTSVSGMELVSQALKLGISAYIKKPFEKEQFRLRVLQVIQGIKDEEGRKPGAFGTHHIKPTTLPISDMRGNRPYKILIIDPKVQFATILEDLLEFAFHKVSITLDFEEAVQISEIQQPDIILINLSHPEITKPRELANIFGPANARAVTLVGYLSEPGSEGEDLGENLVVSEVLNGFCRGPFCYKDLMESIRFAAGEKDNQTQD